MTPRRLVSIPCALLGILLLAVPMLAVEKGNTTDIVRVTIDPSAITVEPETELDNGRIRLLNPEGLEIIRDFEGGFGQVTVDDLAREVEDLSLDGCWTYEIVGTPSLTKTEQSLLKKARETGRPAPGDLQLKLESMYQSGSFNIERGRMVFDPNTGETDNDGKLRADVPNSFDNGGLGAAPTDLAIGAEVPTGLDQTVISGDLTVYNSLCVGFDCPTNPTFNADTIRLQENNLRIHFEDTSTAAGFPSRDWRIIANDQASGGLSRFSVQDVTGNRIPFTIEAAAPSNSLYADSSGRVGFGTSNPVLELHAVNGDTPALRLDQDGSSGFQPQVWDLAGNETSFFVRDATNGSTLPFRIFPGSSSNSLVIRDSEVGIGTTSPGGPLHIRQGSDDVMLVDVGSTSPSGTTQQLFSPDGSSGIFYSQALDSGLVIFGAQTNSNFAIRTNGTTDVIRITTVPRVGILNTNPVHPLQVGTDASNGNGAHVTIDGVWTNGSSRKNKTNIRDLLAEEALSALDRIQPVRYYGANPGNDEEYLGFIAEDVPGLVAMNDRKGIASMDVVAMLTAVMKAQRETIEQLEARVKALESPDSTP